jgi:hypothetical protein
MPRHCFKKLPSGSERMRGKYAPEIKRDQDCQTVYFQTKNPTLAKFGRAVE